MYKKIKFMFSFGLTIILPNLHVHDKTVFKQFCRKTRSLNYLKEFVKELYMHTHTCTMYMCIYSTCTLHKITFSSIHQNYHESTASLRNSINIHVHVCKTVGIR